MVLRKRVQFQANKPFEFKNEELVQFFGYARWSRGVGGTDGFSLESG
jgi:hypothetical protein